MGGICWRTMPGPLSATVTRKRVAWLAGGGASPLLGATSRVTTTSGRMPASSEASSALSTASLTQVRSALRGLSKPSRWRFLVKNSETEMSRWRAPISVADGAAALGSAVGGLASAVDISLLDTAPRGRWTQEIAVRPRRTHRRRARQAAREVLHPLRLDHRGRGERASPRPVRASRRPGLGRGPSGGGRRPGDLHRVEPPQPILAERAVPEIGELLRRPTAGRADRPQRRRVREHGDLAAAHADDLTGDVGGAVAGQERGDRRDGLGRGGGGGAAALAGQPLGHAGVRGG